MKEIDISRIIDSIDFQKNFYQDIGNGLMLTNREIEILNKYHIPYLNCHSLKEILFEVEEVINYMGIAEDDLDYLSSSLAERDYYLNTNK